MKKSVPAFIALIFIGTLCQSQTYCIPPPFIDGPYTGVTNVRVDAWANATPYNDGYKYFNTVEGPELTTGEDYSITIESEHTLLGVFSGNLNLRAWIDWNMDGDFEDADETVLLLDDVYYSDENTATFTVPGHAQEGTTRMRIYEDMPDYEGHDPPLPCGYLNSTNPIGHHGESEDYDVTIVAPVDTSGSTDTTENLGIAAPVKAAPYLYISANGTTCTLVSPHSGKMKYQLYNSMGQPVSGITETSITGGANNLTLQTSGLATGVYFLSWHTERASGTTKFFKQ